MPADFLLKKEVHDINYIGTGGSDKYLVIVFEVKYFFCSLSYTKHITFTHGRLHIDWLKIVE